MATVTKTFTFGSNAESWVASGGTADTTLAWASAGGNTGGCLSSRILGRNKSADPHWYYAGTWESMGVPAGATVTNIQLLGFDWRCSEYTTGANTTQVRLSYLYDSLGTTQIAALSTSQPTVSATTSYATISGTAQSVGASYQASNTSVQLWWDIYLRTGNAAAAAVTLLMDNFSIEITYTEATPINVLTATGELTLTGQAPTVSVSDNKNILTDTGELTLTGFEPTVTVSDHKNIVTSTGELTLTGYEPTVTVTNHINILTSTGELTLTGYAPTVSITESPTFISSVKSLVFSADGSPWARIAKSADIGVDSLQFSLDGSPWWGVQPLVLSWTAKPLKYYTGGTWVAGVLKYHNGSTWVAKDLKVYI